jgi:ATP-binding cassette subfamily B (MDR/TAP) protein 1
LLLSVIANVVMLALNLGPLFQVYAASDRIKELIDVPTSQKGSFKPSGEVKGNLQIEHVNFSYPQNEDIQVLKDVSIHVDNGKNRVVALVGYSGCGKSSIISLIEQFCKPTQGAVLFNGINIETLDPAWYH